jgi:hypothetical protein
LAKDNLVEVVQKVYDPRLNYQDGSPYGSRSGIVGSVVYYFRLSHRKSLPIFGSRIRPHEAQQAFGHMGEPKPVPFPEIASVGNIKRRAPDLMDHQQLQ